MGKIAFWSGIAGAADAYTREYEADRAAAVAELDRSRKERLEVMRNEHLLERQKRAAGYEAESLGTKISSQQEQLVSKFGQQDKTLEQQQTFKAEESEKQRKHEKELMQVKSATAADKKKYSRWRFGKIKEVGEDWSETEQTTVSDKETGLTFIQQGSKFVPQGVDLSNFDLPAKKRQAEKWVINNPDKADLFIETYGYLPAGFFRKHGGK